MADSDSDADKAAAKVLADHLAAESERAQKALDKMREGEAKKK